MKTLIHYLTTFILILILTASCKTNKPLTPEAIQPEHIGPEKGALVIVGGAMRDTAIVNRFIELAGGKDAKFVVVPTAGYSEEAGPERYSRFLTRLGVENVTVLHTTDPEEANTEEFIAPLKEATGLWFGGGRQWRIVDAYEGTITEEAFRKVLERGGVIGGSSAGATIQGTYLARGDTKTNLLIMGDHEEGFDYLKNSAIDQHLLQRNRQFDLIEVVRTYPELLGIGLDENTAIIVEGNEFEVMGESFVAIYDYSLWEENPAVLHTLPNGGKFFLLREGDRYDLKNRKVLEFKGNGRNIFPDPAE